MPNSEGRVVTEDLTAGLSGDRTPINGFSDGFYSDSQKHAPIGAIPRRGLLFGARSLIKPVGSHHGSMVLHKIQLVRQPAWLLVCCGTVCLSC